MKALVDSQLQEMIAGGGAYGVIRALHEGIALSAAVQPASVDLTIGDEIVLVKHKFVPFARDVAYIADKLCVERYDAREEVILFKGQTYLIPCLAVDLTDGVFGRVSPKSSIGRIDVLVRAVFDHSGFYDTVPAGGHGQLWLEVTPQSFNIKVRKGVSLSQLRLFVGDASPAVTLADTSFLTSQAGDVLGPVWYGDAFAVGLGLSLDLVGYEARFTNEVVDMTQVGSLPGERFFKPLYVDSAASHRKLVLEKDRFYILMTKEVISVPPVFSMEMVPFSHLLGELRAHYAGFFDPGFSSTGVLEVRPHEDLVVYDGQPICLMQVYENTQLPEVVYGDAGNNYQGQIGPKLAKYFG